jgi:hypothetical protein
MSSIRHRPLRVVTDSRPGLQLGKSPHVAPREYGATVIATQRILKVRFGWDHLIVDHCAKRGLLGAHSSKPTPIILTNLTSPKHGSRRLRCAATVEGAWHEHVTPKEKGCMRYMLNSSVTDFLPWGVRFESCSRPRPLFPPVHLTCDMRTHEALIVIIVSLYELEACGTEFIGARQSRHAVRTNGAVPRCHQRCRPGQQRVTREL